MKKIITIILVILCSLTILWKVSENNGTFTKPSDGYIHPIESTLIFIGDISADNDYYNSVIVPFTTTIHSVVNSIKSVSLSLTFDKTDVLSFLKTFFPAMLNVLIGLFNIIISMINMLVAVFALLVNSVFWICNIVTAFMSFVTTGSYNFKTFSYWTGFIIGSVPYVDTTGYETIVGPGIMDSGGNNWEYEI
jgi:hypothetical protein